ncbi:Hpt domain-containing protein [Marinicella rhabdoformis]|uniref:Hpt domain-containing protein n=1 Tax=Marinicella rhabdoformis TaxID=2580566 RepID=UPI0015CFA732
MNLKSQQLFKSASLTDPFEQLKAKYLSTFDDKCLAIKKALNDNNHSALYQVIHQLNGSAGSYGFDAISEHCLKLENRLGDCQAIDSTVEHLSVQLIEIINQAKA